MAVELTGESVKQLQLKSPTGHFSNGTALYLAHASLEAIEHLHKIGYVHRNINPDHFLIGRGRFIRRLYIISFCNSRRYKGNDGVLYRERQRVKFVSTPRYASPSALRLKDQGRKDDLISWFFMVVELFRGSLPWSTHDIELMDEEAFEYKQLLEEVADEKEKIIFNRPEILIGDAPQELHDLLRYLMALDFDERPDYTGIRNFLFEICSTTVEDKTQLLDFEPSGMTAIEVDRPDMDESFVSDLQSFPEQDLITADKFKSTQYITPEFDIRDKHGTGLKAKKNNHASRYESKKRGNAKKLRKSR
ncbi:unnamed protein product [Soboliphyme baturini]|uniref:Protein kinase domain-containing protein n=1 Tax=Soboliphyme baturini TaxID=241478 RepID=A0A183J6T3_9BILA|nr:unnamed protein product [Soboliphyme baturini]